MRPPSSSGSSHNENLVLHKRHLTDLEGAIMATPHHPSTAVRRSLRKLGGDIKDARRRRGLPTEVVAQRAFTSRSTLRRIEAGDNAVGIGIYAAVLQALGLLDRLGDLAAPGQDEVGLSMASETLPQRVRIKRPKAGDHG